MLLFIGFLFIIIPQNHTKIKSCDLVTDTRYRIPLDFPGKYDIIMIDHNEIRKEPFAWVKAVVISMNPITPTDRLQQWCGLIADFTFPRWHELPEIDLYMDQVVGYLSQKLAVFYDTDDDRRSITATMINNYVKQKIVPPPVKKRYGRAAVSALMVLFCVKQVLSIGLCGGLISQCLAEVTGLEGDAAAQEFHNRFCHVFEEVLHHTVAGDEAFSCLPALREEDSTLTAAAIAFANQIYAERMIQQKMGDSAPAVNEKEKDSTAHE